MNNILLKSLTFQTGQIKWNEVNILFEPIYFEFNDISP